MSTSQETLQSPLQLSRIINNFKKKNGANMENAKLANTFSYLKNQIEKLDIFKVLDEKTDYIKDIAKTFDDCDDILVFGTGGSSLGGKCLVNFQAQYDGFDPRVTFIENTDSRSFMNKLENCDPEKTGIIVISKSGKTTEPLMLFLSVLEIWKNFDYKRKAVAITELSENNDLLTLADSLEMRVFEHNKNIGGRFSVFSIVGLLPALLGEVDIDSFISGAKTVIDEIKNTEKWEDCGIFKDIVMMHKVFANGKVDQHVLMSYSDMLEDFGKWFVQLVGESLGKTEKFGITPIKATGTVDQHSLLQLFLGGPCNKLFTVVVQKHNLDSPKISNRLLSKPNISEEILGAHVPENRSVYDIHEASRNGATQKLPERCRLWEKSIKTDSKIINSLRGHSVHELMLSHQRATIEVLRKKAAVRVLEFEEFNIGTIGFLMMLSFVEVVTIAHLAEINPFDQPAVEESKKLVLQYLAEMK